MSHCRCGLLTLSKDAVPLRGIEVELEVRDHVVTVFSTLHYDNKEDKPIEAVFVFPMPADAAVCHFSATMGQTTIVAELKEKQQAREDYDDALSSGQQAFLLEESDQSPDIFSLSVGSLPPGQSATIRLEYVAELALQADHALRFNLPAVLNPRYQPQGSGGESVQITAVPASLVPYTLSLSARVSSPRSVSKVESSCALEPLQFLNAEQTQATVKLAAGHRFDRDVELLIYYQDAHRPAAVVEAGRAHAKHGSLMGDPVVMLSLYPEFPQSLTSSLAACGEFIFLLDRSGSMGSPLNHNSGPQSRISSARDTLMLLLKSLSVGCYFNIYSFGSQFEHIFPKSVEYNQKTMEKALTKVMKMESDLGGTEILEPLKHIFQQPCIPKQPRQLFVFTDGEVGNTKMVTNLVKQNAASHRCFSFGIGEGASSALITGLASEGGGHAQFITGTDRMQPKVMQSLRFALQPAVVDISITWDLPKELSVTVLSPPITALFHGQRSLVYAQLTGQSCEAAEGHVTVKYTLAGSPAHSQLSFSVQPTEDTGSTVHRLAARTLIRSLEKEEPQSAAQSKVVDLSIQSGVSSAFTAFIAVNKDNQQMVQGPLVRRNIPAPMMMMSMMACSMPQMMPQSMPMAKKGKARFLKKKKSVARAAPCIMNCGLDDDEADMDGVQYMGMGGVGSLLPPEGLGIRAKSLSIEHMDSGASAQPPADPLLQLVSLQKASGCWDLEPQLAAVLGKASVDVQAAKPQSVQEQVWASILALIWLHGFRLDARLEWELLAMKAASWLRAQSAPCVSECVAAANTLLGCSVQENALGL